jgi:hypothetical protein
MYFKLVAAIMVYFIAGKAQSQQAGYKWNIMAGGQFPTGNFHETHFPGLSAGIEYSKNRFGKTDSLPEKKWGFLLGSRFDYYLGRKKITSGYSFTYANYSVLHFSGGIICNPVKAVNFRLSAGPAVSYYQKKLRFNTSSALFASWYFSPNWGISPGLLMITETGARPLWSLSFTANYCF